MRNFAIIMILIFPMEDRYLKSIVLIPSRATTAQKTCVMFLEPNYSCKNQNIIQGVDN